MNSNDLYILTERKNNLLKEIAYQFSLPKAKRGDVSDLHNRLSRVKGWLKEPVNSWYKQQEEELIQQHNDYNHQDSEKFWEEYNKHLAVFYRYFPDLKNDRISNTSFETTTGKIKL